MIQYKAYIDYSANNSYNQILSPSDYSTYMDTYNSKCAPAISDCYNSGTDDSCSSAQNTCYQDIEYAIISSGDFDVYDLRQPYKDPYPPKVYQEYLGNTTVQNAIGAQSQYQECANDANSKFQETGDSECRLHH